MRIGDRDQLSHGWAGGERAEPIGAGDDADEDEADDRADPEPREGGDDDPRRAQDDQRIAEACSADSLPSPYGL